MATRPWFPIAGAPVHVCLTSAAAAWLVLFSCASPYAATTPETKKTGSAKPAAQHSGKWKIQPKIGLSEMYTDNIRLASGSGKPGTKADAAFLTAISPNLSIRHDGKSRFTLDYMLQNVFYTGTDISQQMNHRMQMYSHTPLLEETMVLDSSSTMGQYNASSGNRSALDSFSQTGGSQTFRTMRLSPYWTPHFGGYADGVLQLTYSQTTAGKDFGSDAFGQTLYMGNKKQQETLTWQANLNNQTISRDDTRQQPGQQQDVRFRNYNAELKLRLSEHIKPFIQAGSFDNNLGTTSQVSSISNGNYWTAGLEWRPSRKIDMEAGYGVNNYFAGLKWLPSTRTSLEIMYRNSEVGGIYGNTGSMGITNANTGVSAPAATGGTGLGNGISGDGGGLAAGTGWAGGNTTAGLSGSGFGSGGFGGSGYGSSGFGSSGFGSGGFGTTGAGFAGGTGSSTGGGYGGTGMSGFGSGGFGQLGAFNAGTTWNAQLRHRTKKTTWYASYGLSASTIEQTLLEQSVSSQQGNSIALDQPDFTSEIITRQRGQIGFQFSTAKTSLSLTGYQEKRNYQTSGDQSVLGASAYWNWRLTQSTGSLLSLGWQSTDGSSPANAVSDSTNNLKMVSVGLNRRIWEELNGYLEFRHTEQDSNIEKFQFRENRVTASVFMGF